MKALKIIVLLLVIAGAIAGGFYFWTKEKDNYVGQDILLNLPNGWVEDFDFSPGETKWVSYHKQGNTDDEKYEEGFILKATTDIPDNMSLQEYFDKGYEECSINNPEPDQSTADDVLYEPCTKDNIEEWNKISIGEKMAYRSGIHTVQGTVQEADSIVLILNKKIIFLNAYYGDRGETEDEIDRQKKTTDEIFTSLKLAE